MDDIGNALRNGSSIELGDQEIDQKPILVTTGISVENPSKIHHSSQIGGSKVSLRMPMDNTYGNESVSYRVLPLKVDQSMDGISEADVHVPVTPILASALSNDNSEPRLALISSDGIGNTTNAPTVVVSGGQVFVISDSSTVTSSSRQFLPRPPVSDPSNSPVVLQNHRVVSTREEKRRVTHNEVERRRRDKINNWICKLASVLPEEKGFDLQQKSTSQVSKGLILAKACDYIEQMQSENQSLISKLEMADKQESHRTLLQREIEMLREQVVSLKNENAQLKSHLNQSDLTS